ncbi:DUF4112 domain-containing protein [Bdellovibrio bacteriovorus]|uniref:DUF4112 domain-containing protein n=1 Tax=Bdellovibrio bacteriovorus TaxID=959 RepID=UPI0009BDF10B|nr:DUF4112 domain-containing protein [Bdellovibrio bacteriovorus]
MAQGIQDLEYIANQMDTRFRGPLGFRFGWDGILGLIPGVGDLVTSSFSFYIIFRAAAMGAPPVIIARMGLNVLIDNVFDVVPVLGWIFDFAWKANQKNVRLLQSFTFDQRRTQWQSRLWVFVVLFIIFALIGCFVAGGFYLLWLMISFLSMNFS